MKTSLFAVAAIAAASALAAPASAATYVVNTNGQSFAPPVTFTDLGSGSYTGGTSDLFRTNRGAGITRDFTVNYLFDAPVDGSGSISFTTTSAAVTGTSALLQILTATFNGAPVTITQSVAPDGAVTYMGNFAFNNATAGDPFALTLGGRVRVGGTLSTSLAFTAAAVPEPATWAMMIGGFGVAGGALRRRRTMATTVTYA